MPRNTRGQRWLQRWRRLPPWGKVSIVTGLVVGLSGSVTGVRAAWPTIKLGLPAPIVYVDISVDDVHRRLSDKLDDGEKRQKVAQQTQTSILRDLQIESNEGKKAAAANALANWKLEKFKATDPVTLNLIDQQIHEKEAEIERLNSQNRTLNRLKSQGQ